MRTILPIVRLYRADHPESRAVGLYVLTRSSARIRRASCTFCRQVIATCSNEWRPTRRWYAEIEAHNCDARAMYEARVARVD
jgi:hypothetical protein